jgi:hypothetical protein
MSWNVVVESLRRAGEIVRTTLDWHQRAVAVVSTKAVAVGVERLRTSYWSDVGFTSFRVFTFLVFAFWGSLLAPKRPVGGEMKGPADFAKMDSARVPAGRAFCEDRTRCVAPRDCALLAGGNWIRRKQLILAPVWQVREGSGADERVNG